MSSEPVAITGLGCRFPGAGGPEEYWRMLREGRDAIVETPASRWSLDEYFDPDPAAPGKLNSRFGSFLEAVDQFDYGFFGISAAEASSMDPQQRLFLEVTWEALEDAGLAVERLRGSRTGVFSGIMYYDYGHSRMQCPDEIDALTGPGISLAVTANRISYLFDFCGPSLAIDTACSSSLVAIHLACESLRRRECDLALAGGVSLMLSPASSIFFTKAGLLSPDGRCKSFDAAADGLGRGEGCGVVVLKTLQSALASGDRVYAVVPGSAINHDGASNGLGAPSRFAQEALLRAAYERAGVPPAHLQYVEAHGTGTPLGDPIEARALGGFLGADRDERCLLGSVKSNIGHLEAAAGVAGLIKVALMLQRRQLLASLNFASPNPAVPWDRLPIRVQQSAADWPRRGTPRIAGVTALGFGGANAHVVLQEAPNPRGIRRGAHCWPAAGATRATDGAELLTVSARSGEALHVAARQLAGLLADPGSAWDARSARAEPPGLADVCFTRNARRSHHRFRLAVVGRTSAEISSALVSLAGDSALDRRMSVGAGSRSLRVVGVFGGAEGWWPEALASTMARPVVAAVIRDLARRLGAGSAVEELESYCELADRTRLSGPALLLLQMGLTALWRSWGIELERAVARGAGGPAAGLVGGALSLSEAYRQARRSGHIAASEGVGFEGVDLVLEPGDPDAFLLLGPAEELAEALANQLEGRSCRAPVLSTMEPPGEGLGGPLEALAALYTLGAEVAWDGLYPDGGRCVSLPSYPWQRRPCPLPPQPGSGGDKAPSESQTHPLLHDHRPLVSPAGAHLWEMVLDRAVLGFLDHHRIDGEALMPGAAYVEMAVAAALRVWGPCSVELRDLQLDRALFLAAGSTRVLQLVLAPSAAERWTFSIGSRPEGGQGVASEPPTPHAAGSLTRFTPADAGDGSALLALIASRCHEQIAPEEHYRALARLGFDLGAYFRPIRELRRGRLESLAEVAAPAAVAGTFHLHPVLLDSSFQVLAAAVPERYWDGHQGGLLLPVAVDRIRVRRPLVGRCRSHGLVRQMEERSLCGDVSFYDESGSPVVEIVGLRSRWVDRRSSVSVQQPPTGSLYEVVWSRQDDTADATESERELPRQWLVLADGSGLGDVVVRELEGRGESCVLARPDELDGGASLFDPLLGGLRSGPIGVLHLCSLDERASRDAAGSTAHALELISSVLACVRALAALRRKGVGSRLWVATADVHLLDGDRPRQAALARAPLWGLGRAVALEQPSIWGGLIDLSSRDAASDLARSLVDIVRRPGENQVVVRAGHLFVPRLRPAAGAPADREPFALRSEATYVVSGGLGGLGLFVAGWMADRGARHLVLLSRSGLAQSSKRGRIEAVEALRARGVRVLAGAVDVADPDEIDRLRQTLDSAGWPRVRGVVHAAGLARQKPLVELFEEEIDEQLRAKMTGALLLHRCFASRELDFFVLFSSAAALLSTHAAGLAAYAAGNSFLDAMARHLRAGESGVEVSVNWGPWGEIGLAAGREEALNKRGIGIISPGAGVAALEEALRSRPAQVAVMPMDWGRWRNAHPLPWADSIAARLIPASEEGRSKIGTRSQPEAATGQDEELRPLLERLVTRYLPNADSGFDPRAPLTDLGLDSLAATELANRLESELGVELPVVKLLAGSSFVELEDWVLGRRSPRAVREPAPARQRTAEGSERANQRPQFSPVKVSRPGAEVPPPLPWSVDYSSLDYSRRPALHRLVRGLVRLAVGSLARVDIEGLERIPAAGPVVLAYNHISRLDKFGLIALQPRRCALFGAGRGRYRPRYRWCVDRLFDVIYIDRGSADMVGIGQALDLLSAGGGLAVAPEGEISDTAVLMRGHTGVAFMAARTGATVVPTVAWGQELAARSWRRLRRVAIQVRIGQPMSPPSRRAEASDLQCYTDRLMKTMASLLPVEYRGDYEEDGGPEPSSSQLLPIHSRTSLQ